MDASLIQASTGPIMPTFTAVDLSHLPPPALVEPLDFETILAQRIAKLRELYPQFDALTDSDPSMIHLQESAYRELDASAASPAPGEVPVTALARQGDGTASPALVSAVERVLTDDRIRAAWGELVAIRKAAGERKNRPIPVRPEHRFLMVNQSGTPRSRSRV
ncbi:MULTISPECIES: hypothetical protein [Lysobacter]|uniref:hypothetical protein n=1 Tax=Lysobacter TaxID=68 RepID=UPI001F1926E3|nr:MULTISPECIES: hypothetical protein [Lysobacter]UJB20288.1 hypothetical protein L1A79_04180 [Lysobacter capsici]UJQ30598.1 hypothetical protein L2D09_10680 [Lysobacter gummosus]